VGENERDLAKITPMLIKSLISYFTHGMSVSLNKGVHDVERHCFPSSSTSNQSINQSINHSVNQSIINQPISQSEAFVRRHIKRLSGAVQQYHDKRHKTVTENEAII